MFNSLRHTAKMTNRLRLPIRFIHSTNDLLKLIQYKLSDIGEGIAEVQLKDWHIKVGDKINEFDEICSVQSDKATVTITSRYEGIVKKLHFEIDDIAKVGQSLIDIEVEDDADSVSRESGKTPVVEMSATRDLIGTSSSKKLLATPAVRRLIRENNIDLTSVDGTGRDGRVLKEDILKLLGVTEQGFEKPTMTSQPISQAAKAISIKPIGDKIVPIRGYTRGMIKSMTEALKIPHFGYNDEFVIDRLIQVRNELNEVAGEKYLPKLSYMPLIIKATSLALTEFPVLNSSIDEKMENLIYKSYHNISLAMDTPSGLVVPNIKNCESKNVWEIADDLSRLLKLGQLQKFSKEDLIDGTFSLSNIGAVGGGTYMSPLIFPPQVAIGAIGRIQKVARVNAKTGSVDEQSLLHFSWAADHRVIDGATMARFSNRLKQFIENPSTIIAELR